MSSFTICFSFRDQAYFASVYRSEDNAYLYTIYFTDVDLILEFGSKVEYRNNGELQLAKEIDADSRFLLQQVLAEQLKHAA